MQKCWFNQQEMWFCNGNMWYNLTLKNGWVLGCHRDAAYNGDSHHKVMNGDSLSVDQPTISWDMELPSGNVMQLYIVHMAGLLRCFAY
jgi:hypothetical protein